MTRNTFTEFSKILLFSFKLVIVVFYWILFCNTNFHHHVQGNRETLKLTEDRYNEYKNKFGLIDPYELVTVDREPIDLKDIRGCRCPRVFYPACGYNNITYHNICVLNCMNQTTMRRLGPCIKYRRMNAIVLNLNMPARWKNPNTN